ncbi:MAG: hypothetical protein GXO49_06435 [Chlorobi bacterium]|nr:hypothetical protein [Chlorobiota bacterium]
MIEKKVTNSKQNEIVCNNCGAELFFEPGTDSLKCHYCGSINKITVDIDKISDAIEELDYNKYINEYDTAPKIEITTVKCNDCGAETTFDTNVVSDKCDFCGSPLISKEAHTSQIIAPKAMLPFKVSKKEGFELYEKWIKGLWFAPNGLKKQSRQTDDLSGIYTPFWTYDSDTYTEYSGQRGDYYYTTETYYENGQQRTRQVRHTNWRYVSGRVSNYFDDVMVHASNSLPRKYVSRLEPWDLQNLVPFNPKYLAGFKSETYRVALPDGFTYAKSKMEPVIIASVRRDIGGDEQRISNMVTHYNNTSFKHILLPVWLSTYKYKDKIYRFLINGRTGNVQGERPWSWIKITLAVLAAASIIGGIYWYSEVYMQY